MLMSSETRKPAAAINNPDDLLRWYIVRACSGAESQVRRALLNRGIDVFMPWFFVQVRRDRWYRDVRQALFPGYIFVGLEPGQTEHDVKQVNGVMHFLKINDRFIEVPAHRMDSIRLQAADELMASEGAKTKVVRVNVGDWVAIPEGRPFEGTPVQIDAIDKRGQITASLGPGTVQFPLSALTEACRRPLKAIP